MSDERFDRLEKLMEQLIRAVGNVGAELEEVKTTMVTKDEMASLKDELTEVKLSQLRMEQEYGPKLAALSDGFHARGDEISHLKEHLDERLDALQTDLSYVVGKVAQHDRNIVQLRKQAK